MGPMDLGAQPMLPLKHKALYSLCFICFGNICRSPALAAVFTALAQRKKVDEHFFVDSMALTTYYLGKQADARMRSAAAKKQIEIDHIAHLFRSTDFPRFDLIFGATSECLDILHELATTEEDHKKILLATAFSKNYRNQDIPDPYYDGPEAFDRVMEMALDACEGILSQVQV
jgi:protein-tyrosine phosphatase